MKPMKKTDFCASVLCDAMVTINGIPDLLKLSTDEIEALKDAVDKGKAAKEYLLTIDEKSIFMTEDDALEVLFPKRELIKKLTRLKSLFWYRILPAYNIDIEGKGMDNVYTDLYLANQYTGGDYYNIVWETLQDQSISLKDLEDELWENLRGVDEINKYLEITRVKFNPITSHISDLKKFSMQNLFYTDNQYKNGLSNLSAIGVISPEDEALILKMIHFIAKEIDLKIFSISSMYNKLKKMNLTNSKKADPKTFPIKLTDENAKKLMSFLISNKFIKKETQVDVFLYWMGCTPENQIQNLQAIRWESNKQLARELLTTLYSDIMSPSEIEKLTPICFYYKNKPLILAKPKPVPSTSSDQLKDFLATL